MRTVFFPVQHIFWLVKCDDMIIAVQWFVCCKQPYIYKMQAISHVLNVTVCAFKCNYLFFNAYDVLGKI